MPFIFWIIFLLDLELNFIGKLLVFRLELIVLLLLQICFFFVMREILWKKGKRKVQGVPQSQTAALPRPQEEEETDKSKQAQTEQTYEKH